MSFFFAVNVAAPPLVIVNLQDGIKVCKSHMNVKDFENELICIQTQINNTVNAIANGMFRLSMKQKMDDLEARKTSH